MGRAPCCDKANVKRGPWSPEEDAILRDYMDKFGTCGNWIALPQKAGLKRCGKSCRLRWLNYLRPNIKHGEFSDEEDRVICTLYASIGSRWSIIAAQLPGRTDNDIKNYWNTKLKKKLMGIMTFPQQQWKPLPPPPPSSSLSLYHNFITNPSSLQSHFLPPLMNLNSTISNYNNYPPKTLQPPYFLNETDMSLANTDTTSLLQTPDSLSFLGSGNDQVMMMNGSSSGHGNREIKQEETLFFHDYVCNVLQGSSYTKSNIDSVLGNNNGTEFSPGGTDDAVLEDVKRLICSGLMEEKTTHEEKNMHYFW